MKTIKKILKPEPMQDVWDCIREAVIEAMQSECDIEFKLNGRAIKIDHANLIKKYYPK